MKQAPVDECCRWSNKTFPDSSATAGQRQQPTAPVDDVRHVLLDILRPANNQLFGLLVLHELLQQKADQQDVQQ